MRMFNPSDPDGIILSDRQPRLKRRNYSFFLVMICSVLFMANTVQSKSTHDVNAAEDIHRHYNRNEQVYKYPGETIEWRVCGHSDGRNIECSSINVPMDQFDRANSGDKIFSIPLARVRGKNATRTIILNPGGPGESGIKLIHDAATKLQVPLGEDFHIMSFDPRGVNGSRPSAACYPDQRTRDLRSPVRVSDPVRDNPELYAWTKNFVRACADTMGEHGKYINTPQTAADMNSILDAIGQNNMIYWGFSYGTTLGQTYATMFPWRSERIIIDGVQNQFEWYTKLMAPQEFTDSEKVVEGFFDECIKAGKDCPLSSFGKTKQELQRTITTFLQNLKQDPMSVYIDSKTYGVVDYYSMWMQAVFLTMYTPKDWYKLANNLAKLMRGDGSAALLAYQLQKFDDPVTLEHEIIIGNNDGISGNKEWPQGNTNLLKLLLPHFNISTFALSTQEKYYAKSMWRIPKTHNYVPSRQVKTLHPLLILSTTYDPITPLVSARAARTYFADSRLVEVKGYGHCSTALYSACAFNHIRNYLLNGTLPKTDTTCKVDQPYFQEYADRTEIRPEEEQSSNNNGMREAQLALANAISEAIRH